MSSQAREISASKKCVNLSTLDAAVILVSLLLWLQLSSVVMLDYHLILIKSRLFHRLLKKDHLGQFLIKCCLVLIKSTLDIVYGVAWENNAVDLLPYQKQGKTIPWIASTLPKMHSNVSLDILAFFL